MYILVQLQNPNLEVEEKYLQMYIKGFFNLHEANFVTYEESLI